MHFYSLKTLKIKQLFRYLSMNAFTIKELVVKKKKKKKKLVVKLCGLEVTENL